MGICQPLQGSVIIVIIIIIITSYGKLITLWSLNAKPGWLAFGDPTCSKRPKQRVKVELGSVIPEVLTIPDLLKFEV
jgi:hypothetical protein